MRRRDYKVSFKSDRTIAGIVEEFRERAGISQSSRFDITKVLRWLTQVEIPYKGKLHIKSLEGDRTDPYVMFKPLRLHVSDEMMEHASLGDPDSQFKLGHETGHIILHDHYAQAFSFDPDLQIKYAQDEESAEWQANRFAYHLLLPNKFVRIFQGDIRQIIESCGVLDQIARDRVQEVISRKSYTGEVCPNCGDFSLRSNGIDFECDSCGATMCR